MLYNCISRRRGPAGAYGCSAKACFAAASVAGSWTCVIYMNISIQGEREGEGERGKERERGRERDVTGSWTSVFMCIHLYTYAHTHTQRERDVMYMVCRQVRGPAFHVCGCACLHSACVYVCICTYLYTHTLVLHVWWHECGYGIGLDGYCRVAPWFITPKDIAFWAPESRRRCHALIADTRALIHPYLRARTRHRTAGVSISDAKDRCKFSKQYPRSNIYV